jgi:ABC-type multidrug transport system fused ATPase/permease subunit
MNYDLEKLRDWLRICLIVASVCTTAFPILYAFTPWYRSILGRALMLQAIAFSLAIDLTLFFQYYEITPDNIKGIFWLNLVVFTLIAVATVCLTVIMVKMNYTGYRRKKETQDV